MMEANLNILHNFLLSNSSPADLADDGLAEVDWFTTSPPVTNPDTQDNQGDLFLLEDNNAMNISDTNVSDLQILNNLPPSCDNSNPNNK